MRVLLDECLPSGLKRLFRGHEVATAAEMGWAGKTNGELLRLAEDQFEVFITSDRNLAFQQNVPALDIAVIVLVATSNRLTSLQSLMPEVLRVLPAVRPGTITQVGSPTLS